MTGSTTTTSTPGAPGSRAFRWPGDRRIAAIVNIAYEAWGDDRAPGIGPMGNPLPSGAFDTNSRSWGDYGADHGIHRLLRILAGAQVRGSVMVSGILADRLPANVQAIADGGHEIIAHGYSQDLVPASLSKSDDKANIEKTTLALERVTGQRPFGWASPRSTPGVHTIQGLAEAGYRWHSDAMDADLPYEQTFGDSSIVAIPFGMDINDLPHAIRFGRTPQQYIEMFDDLLEHLSHLSDEPLIIDVTAHAHNYGRPGGAWAYQNVVSKLAERSDIWLATRAEITTHYQEWTRAQ
jgi:peptidoglycan/xylan/chitin deacetylase (PgdA/CDA1 family)